MKRLVVVSLLLTGCACEAELCAEKLAQLDALRKESQADLFRQQAECKAIAIEFSGDRMLVDNCMETHRLMAEIARRMFADIDKRMKDPDMKRCRANQFDSLDEKR